MYRLSVKRGAAVFEKIAVDLENSVKFSDFSFQGKVCNNSLNPKVCKT